MPCWWGVFEDVYCAGNDEVFTFLTGVLEEVLAIFPSREIHIGGDEVPKDRWRACPKCQARIKAEGLADEAALQSWFVRRIGAWLAERDRRLVGWDEILEGGALPGGAIVQSWRGPRGRGGGGARGPRRGSLADQPLLPRLRPRRDGPRAGVFLRAGAGRNCRPRRRGTCSAAR